ncbi:MAG: HAD-IIA family hydrolase [Nitrososphaerales archaeon]|nr:HAD-IIA family hydrolase [Nitrososphaerales archaeon]
MKRRLDLSRKRLFLFDLDGVFYRGKERPVKIGGTRIVKKLRSHQKKLLLLTNNSTDSVKTVHSRLLALGIPIRNEEILTSGLLTAEYLSRKYGKVSYYLVGEPGLEAEMRRFGHERTVGEEADFVVIGLDRRLSYEKLDHAARLVRNGSKMVATHVSRLYMYKNGPALATGPIVKALEYATGERATVIGKPYPEMFRMALRRAGCTARDALMVGDQVETDIAGAARAGIDAVLVATGVDRSIRGTRALAMVSNVDDLVEYL